MLGPFSLVLFLQNDQFHPHTPARNPNTTSSFLLFFFILQRRKLKTLVNYFLRRKWTSAQSTGCLKTLLKLPQRRLVCVPVGSCEWNAAVHTAVHVRWAVPVTARSQIRAKGTCFQRAAVTPSAFFPFVVFFFFALRAFSCGAALCCFGVFAVFDGSQPSSWSSGSASS